MASLYPETDRQVQIFVKQAETDLKALIKKEHNASGKLADSIKIKLITSQNGYKLTLEANDYIKYLEDGKFIERFMSKKNTELVAIVQKWIVIDIENNILDSFNK